MMFLWHFCRNCLSDIKQLSKSPWLATVGCCFVSCGEQMGTSEIKLGGGLCLMHWPKSLPEIVLGGNPLLLLNVADETNLTTVTCASRTTIGARTTPTTTATRSQRVSACTTSKGGCKSATVVVLCAALSRSEGCRSFCPCGSFQTA